MTESHRLRVLVVEDDPGLREVYAETLELAGHDVRRAAEGSGALAVLESGWTPCVVFLDLRMPGMDGWQLARHIRTEEPWKDIPIVVLAAHYRIDREARDIGAIAWLQKPFDLRRLEDLARTACRAVNGHGSQQEAAGDR